MEEPKYLLDFRRATGEDCQGHSEMKDLGKNHTGMDKAKDEGIPLREHWHGS